MNYIQQKLDDLITDQNLDTLTDAKCKSEFRFFKHDIYTLPDVLSPPEKIICQNHFYVYSDEALCMLLRRFAYPCRYEDLVPRFGRAVPQISMVVNEMLGCAAWSFTDEF